MIKKITLEEIEAKILERQKFRQKYGKWFVISFSILFIILAWVFLPRFITFVHNVCYVREYQEAYSPDGTHKFLVYTNICSSDIYTEISVIPRNSVIQHEHGNVFSSLGNPILFDIFARWDGNQRVVVETNGKATPDLMEDHLDDIEIEYVIRQILPTQKTPFYFTTSTPVPALTSTPTPNVGQAHTPDVGQAHTPDVGQAHTPDVGQAHTPGISPTPTVKR